MPDSLLTSFKTLDHCVIAKGFENTRELRSLARSPQRPSLTFDGVTNFCLTVNKLIMNGQQLKSESCNPAPISVIPGARNIPPSKFVFPQNSVHREGQHSLHDRDGDQ